MNPGKKGWLQEYLDFRKNKFGEYQASKSKAALPDQALYRIIQPTGLMYGQSISVIDHPDSTQWKEKDRLKILLTECLVGSSIIFSGKSGKDGENLQSIIERTIEGIGSFYNHVFPEIATSGTTWLGKKKSPVELAEQILEKRIDSIAKNDNFWVNFFHRSLLFIDIYIFSEWVHTRGDQMVADFFKFQREELRLSVVKVITSAAHANQTVEFEERKLLEYFLQSASLSSEKKKEALGIFEQGVEVEGLDLPTHNSWLLRKYFLEMAVLTTWADKQVEEKEMVFLRRLAKHLAFSTPDLESSILALEGFVLQHWIELSELQNKIGYEAVSERYISRMAEMVKQNKLRLLQEARHNKTMLELLKRANADDWKMEEKLQLRDQLIELLKTIPSFSMVTLPQNFLTLPVMMRILPREFFAELKD
jgi:hypothetical protein